MCEGLGGRGSLVWGEVVEARLAGVVILELADGTFSRARGFSFASATGLRDSTIDALAGSRGRALRVFAALVPWRSHDGISRTSCGHPGAFLARKNSPHGRKMTPPDLPHLMHSMNQGFILRDSQKEIALMRRGLRA